MKTNYYILLILLLSFSFVNAQSQVEAKKIESSVIVSENNDEVSNNDITVSTVKEEGSVEATTIENNVARTTSDIRVYLNRVKNLENIDLLFPKINKQITA